jgi:hypothetical protein
MSDNDPSQARLLSRVADERADIQAARHYQANPNSIRPPTVFANAPPATLDARELYLSSLLMRAGVQEPVAPTPASRAAADFTKSWADPLPSEGDKLVSDEIQRINALSKGEVTTMANTLRTTLGEAEYTELVTLAKSAPGVTWSDAIGASAPALRLYAAHGRYAARREAARQRMTA